MTIEEKLKYIKDRIDEDAFALVSIEDVKSKNFEDSLRALLTRILIAIELLKDIRSEEEEMNNGNKL